MNDNEELILRDEVYTTIMCLRGVSQALGHVHDESTDYEMCQILSNVLSLQARQLIEKPPDSWLEEWDEAAPKAFEFQ